MEKGKFSLSFSKVIERKKLQPSALKLARDKQVESQQEIIESIEENVIKSNAPQKEEPVIPLLQRDKDSPMLAKAKHRQKRPELDIQNPSPHADPHRVLTLEEQAEQALLAEAADPNLQIKRIPSDVNIPSHNEYMGSSTLGSLPTLDDFEEVGIDDFGAAVLRGMGWKKGEGVGSAKNRRVVSIIEASNKTLGASLASRSKAAQAHSAQEEELALSKGSYALISAGRHKGNYGIVESVEEDYVLLRKAVGGGVVREVEANLTLVTKEHYSDSSRVINKEMFDKFKETESNKKKKSSKSSKKKLESESCDSDENSHEQKEELSSKHKHEDQDENKHKSRGAGRHHDISNSDHKNSSLGSSDRTSNSLPNLDQREIDNTKQLASKIKDLKEKNIKASFLQKDSSNALEIDSESSKGDVKSLDAENQFKNLQEAVRCHRAKKDADLSYSDSRTLDRRERDLPHRSESSPINGSKRHNRSPSPDKNKRSKKKAYLESKKLSKNDRSEYHSCSKDVSKSSRKEAQSKEEYLLSKYGDASVTAGGNSASAARSAPWVREGLTVRITSEKFKGGKYFKEKVVVESVVTAARCECRTGAGKLLSHVPPDILETVIPKLPPRTVMVVKGSYAGMLGSVVEQHKSAQEASVQLLEDRSQILRLQYEQICQYGA